MGLFGNNNYQEKVELAKIMAHNANDVNKEIGEIVDSFETDQERFKDVTDDILKISQKILSKLSEEEMKELTNLTERVCALHSDYISKFRKIMEISSNQNKRTEMAIDKYSQIKGI